MDESFDERDFQKIDGNHDSHNGLLLLFNLEFGPTIPKKIYFKIYNS